MKQGMLLLLGLTSLIFSGCSVVQEVQKAPNANCDSKNIMAPNGCKKTEGIPYYLPRTAIKLQIPITKTTEIEPILFSEARKIFASKQLPKCVWEKTEDNQLALCNESLFKYQLDRELDAYFKDEEDKCKSLRDEAEKLGIVLSIENALLKPTITYKLEEIGVSTEAEPDPEQLYFIKLNGGLFEKRNTEVTYSPGGVITQYSASAENKSLEFMLNTYGAVLKAGTEILKLNEETTTANHQNPKTNSNNFCKTSISTNFQKLFSRAVTTLAAIKSYPDIRSGELLGRNNTNISKEALELRLKELDATKDIAMAMFQKQKKSESKSYSISILPYCNKAGKDCAKDGVTTKLAKFSKACGLFADIPETDYAFQVNLPKVPKVKPDCKNESQITITTSLPPHLRDDSANPNRFLHLMDPDKKRGMYYRIPLTVRMTISNDNEPILVKDMAIAQLGAVASLPAETGSTNVSYKVTLDPVTGMLLKVSLVSESANPNVGKDVIDPIANYLEAKEESKDEVTKLEREEAILKLKKSIKELKEAVKE